MDFNKVEIDFEDIFYDDWEILEIINNGFLRWLHQRTDYFNEMDDYVFFLNFVFINKPICKSWSK